MSDHFTAYRNRMKSVSESLLKFGRRMRAKGYTVVIPRGEESTSLIKYIYIIDKGQRSRNPKMCCVISYEDVPYRWCMNWNKKASINHGYSDPSKVPEKWELKFTVRYDENSTYPIWSKLP